MRAIHLILFSLLSFSGPDFRARAEPDSTWIGYERADLQRIKKERPDWRCFERTHGIGEMDSGDSARIEGMCAIATCLADGNVEYSGCPVVKVKPPFYVVKGDPGKPYPDCCFELKKDPESDEDDDD